MTAAALLAVAASLAAIAAAALVALAKATRELDAMEVQLRGERQRVEWLQHTFDGPHGWELGRSCTVWRRGKWHYGCKVVCVSHKGALKVRDGGTDWWVPKGRVGRLVRLEEEGR